MKLRGILRARTGSQDASEVNDDEVDDRGEDESGELEDVLELVVDAASNVPYE